MLEWHLTATTSEKKKRMEFVTLYRPHRIKGKVTDEASLEQIKGGYALRVKLSEGEFAAILPTDDSASLRAYGLTSKGAIKCRLKRDDRPVEILGIEE
jgi:hypothetical protein